MTRRWLWLAIFALAFAPTFAWLVGRWTDSIYRNGHGIFVPFLIAYLALDQLKQDTDPEPRASAWGFAFVGAAVALLVFDSAIKTQILSALALVLALPGLSLLFLGGARTRAIALPLAIGLFMLPIPAGAISALFMVLRTITAIAVAAVLPFLGLPVARDGTILAIPGQSVNVADNCSGFATLYAAILTAVILAHLSRSPARRAIVLAAAVPLALACNVVRVTVLTLLVSRYGGGILETWIHPGSGLFLFVFVIGALVWLAGRDALHGAAGNARPPLSGRFALPAAALFAVALVPVSIHSYLHVRRDDCANPDALVPAMGPGMVTAERDAEVRRNFDVHQWREGRLPPGEGAPELKFAIVRSYDPKQLYYRGTRRLWWDIEPGGDQPDWLEVDGAKLPIVRSRLGGDDDAHRDRDAVIESFTVYEGKPVENGWRTQLRAAPRQAFTGSRPMTLFAIRSDVNASQREAAERRAREWLAASWRNYRAVCGAE
ncbi:MAG TPA: exosortase/archaeosortase family protein [Myxococcota bacterium]|nr:exosortase/archaeosortase family protein [Myxococcota bacterium]